MDCFKLNDNNNEESQLFNTIYSIVKDEDIAEEIWVYFKTPEFIEEFGDYKSNYLNRNNPLKFDPELDSRTDENGEPLLIKDGNGKYYYLDKFNERVYYPEVGLEQYLNIEDINILANTIALNFYQKEIKYDFDNSEFVVNSNLKDYVKNFLQNKIVELNSSDDFEHNYVSDSLSDSMNELNEWVQKVKDYYTSINITVEEENATIEEETTREDLVRKESFLQSSKNNINKNIKLFLSLVKSDTKNKFNEYNFVPFDDIYASLNKTLSNQVALIDKGEKLFDIYKSKIDDLAKIKPYFKNLLSEDKLSSIKDLDNFKNQFTSAFNLFKKNYLISEYTVDKEGNVIYNVKNLTDTGSRKRNILNKWHFQLKEIVKTIPTDKIIIAQKNFKKVYNKLNENNIDTQLNILKNIFNEMGVNFSNDALNFAISDLDVSKEITLKDKIDYIRQAYEKIDYALDYNKNNPNDNLFLNQSLFTKLAEAEAFFQETGSDASVYTLGKTKWFYSNPSYLDIKIEEWKKDPSILIEHYDSTAFTKSSLWMSYLSAEEIEDPVERLKIASERINNIKIGVFNSVQNQDDISNAVDNKNSNYIDTYVDYLNKLLAFKKNGLVYHKTAIAADKLNEYQISYGNIKNIFNINSKISYLPNEKNPNELGDIIVDDYVLEIFYNYFKSEYQRMINEQEFISNPDTTAKDLVDNYHYNKDGIGNAFKSQLFPSLNNNDVVKLYDINGFPIYEDLDQVKEVIKSHISKVMSSNIKDTFNELIDNNIITYDKNGNRQNNLLDENIFNSYVKSSSKSLAYFNIAADFFINSVVSQIEFSKMYAGDTAYYKNIVDYKKRIPETYTDGKYLNNLSPSEKYFNAAIIESVEIGYQDIQQLKEYLEEDIYKYYEKGINDTDAQAWITPERWYFIMKKLGKDNASVRNLYTKMNTDNPTFLPNELKLLAQPLKGVYFDNIKGVPTYLKYSQAVLLPNLIKGTKLENLYNKMVKDENGKKLPFHQQIHELVTKDGIKVGNPLPIKTHDVNGNLLSDFNLQERKIELSNNKWKLQQDLPTKGIKDTAVGSQIQKNIFAGIAKFIGTEKKFYIENKEFTPEQFIIHLNNIVSQLSDIGLSEINNKLGIDENNIIQNEEKLYNNIINQLKKRTDVNLNSIKGLQMGLSPYAIPGISNIFQNVFSSLVNKHVIKIKTNGGGFIQMANYGINKENADKQNIIYTPWHDKNHLPMPELYTDENGIKKLKPSGIFISGSFLSKIIPNYKKIPTEKLFGTAENNYTDGILDKRMLENIIGYRIPNQLLPSNDSLQILGILPDEIGDTVIAYTGITKKTGSDFDIDKMYLMMPSFNVIRENFNEMSKYINKELISNDKKESINNLLSLLNKIDPLNEIDLTNQFNIEYLMDLKTNVDNKNVGYFIQELTHLIANYDGNNDEINNIKKKVLKTRVTKIEYVDSYDEANAKKYYQNQLIEAYKTVLTDLDVISDVLRPIDLDFMEKDIKLTLPEEVESDLKDFSAISDLKLKDEFKLGKAGLGQNVNTVVDKVRGSMGQLSINDVNLYAGNRNEKFEPIFDLQYSEKLNSSELNYYALKYKEKYNEDVDKEFIESINIDTSLLVYTNGFVDIAKDSYITKGNWVTQTNDVGNMLIRAGVHPFKVNKFLQQPYIKDYVRFKSKFESNINKQKGSITINFLLDKLHENVAKLKGDKLVTINNKSFSYNNIYNSIVNYNNVADYAYANTHDLVEEYVESAYKDLDKVIRVSLTDKFKLSKSIISNNQVIRDEITSLHEEIMSDITKYFNKPLKGKEYFKELKLHKLMQQIENYTPSVQLAHLNTYLSYITHSKELIKNIKLSKFDVDGKGKDELASIIIKNLMDDIIKNSNEPNKLRGFDTKLYYNDGTNSLTPTMLLTYYKNSIDYSLKIMESNPKYFLFAQPKVINTINLISNYINDTNLLNADLGTAIKKDYYTYLLSGFSPFKLSNEEKNKLMSTEGVEIYKELESKYRDNIFLQELYPKKINNVDYLQMSNIKKSNDFKNKISNAWLTLLSKEPEKAEKLIQYAYLLSGFNNSLSQFHEFIPVEWFNKNRVNSYLKNLNLQSNTADFNFINQFFRNNLNNSNYVKTVNSPMRDFVVRSNEAWAEIDSNFIGMDKVTPPYAIRIQKRNYDAYYKYQVYDEQSDNYYYTRILHLGKSGKGLNIKEYKLDDINLNELDSLKSFFSDNNIKNDKLLNSINQMIMTYPDIGNFTVTKNENELSHLESLEKTNENLIAVNTETNNDNEKSINIYAGANQNADLSNFANRPFVTNVIEGYGLENYTFNSVENAFQAMKILYGNEAYEDSTGLTSKAISLLSEFENMTASKAKAKGRTIKLNKNELSRWNKDSSKIMKTLLKESFEQNPESLQKLLDTGSSKLTHEQDRTKWKFLFPKLLMEVRDELSNNSVEKNESVKETSTISSEFDEGLFNTIYNLYRDDLVIDRPDITIDDLKQVAKELGLDKLEEYIEKCLA